MRLIIAGSRHLRPTLEDIDRELESFGWEPTLVLCGCCEGPDMIGNRWAVVTWIGVKHYPADWKKHGRAAGPIRNREMAEDADAALVFWDGKSRGTASLIREMELLHKRVRVVRKD